MKWPWLLLENVRGDVRARERFVADSADAHVSNLADRDDKHNDAHGTVFRPPIRPPANRAPSSRQDLKAASLMTGSGKAATPSLYALSSNVRGHAPVFTGGSR
jgi:hypothetical protein